MSVQDWGIGPGDDRLETDLDDDEQAAEVDLWETYIEDPPEDPPEFADTDVVGAQREVGITEQLSWETRRGERDQLIPSPGSAEQDAMHYTRRP